MLKRLLLNHRGKGDEHVQILYNAQDISSYVEVVECVYETRCDHKISHLRIIFEDNQKFELYGMTCGDTIRVRDGSIDTKEMYINKICPANAGYEVVANPIRNAALLETNKKTWNTVKFKKLMCDLAQEMGLEIQFYKMPNTIYSKVEQSNDRNIAFAAKRALLEGCVITVYDGTLVVATQTYLEEQKTPDSLEVDGYEVSVKLQRKYKKCEIGNDDKKGKFTDTDGYGTLSYVMDISSKAEGNRFAKNLLKYFNGYAKMGCIAADELLDQYSAGSVTRIVSEDAPGISGKAFLYRVRHDIVNGHSKVWFRCVEV